MADNQGTEEALTTLVTIMAANYAPLLTGLAVAYNAIGKFTEDVNERYGEVTAKTFYSIATVSVTAAAIAIESWEKVANSLDQTVQQADRLQTSFNTLQSWAVASVLAGKGAGDFANSVERLHDNINELTIMPMHSVTDLFSGSQRPFTMLGISPYALRGLDSGEQINIIANRLSQVKDKTLQLQLAQELLGKSGATMVQRYLKDGAAGLEELRKKTEALNLSLNKDQVESVQNSVIAWRELKLGLQGVATQITAVVAPAFTVIFNILTQILEVVGGLISYFPILSGILFSLAGVAIAAAGGIVILAGAFVVLSIAVGALGTVLDAIVSHPIIASIVLITLAVLYLSGALSGLKEELSGFGIGDANLTKVTNINGSAAADTLKDLLGVSKQMINVEERQLAQMLKQSAPPHMNYSW